MPPPGLGGSQRLRRTGAVARSTMLPSGRGRGESGEQPAGSPDGTVQALVAPPQRAPSARFVGAGPRSSGSPTPYRLEDGSARRSCRSRPVDRPAGVAQVRHERSRCLAGGDKAAGVHAGCVQRAVDERPPPARPRRRGLATPPSGRPGRPACAAARSVSRPRRRHAVTRSRRAVRIGLRKSGIVRPFEMLRAPERTTSVAHVIAGRLEDDGALPVRNEEAVVVRETRPLVAAGPPWPWRSSSSTITETASAARSARSSPRRSRSIPSSAGSP